MVILIIDFFFLSNNDDDKQEKPLITKFSFNLIGLILIFERALANSKPIFDGCMPFKKRNFTSSLFN